jgi:hypothetical protein
VKTCHGFNQDLNWPKVTQKSFKGLDLGSKYRKIGATTFGITTFSIMTLSIMTLSITTHSIMTLSIMTLSIMTLRRKTLSLMTLSIMTLSIMTLSIMTLSIMTLRIMVLIVTQHEWNLASSDVKSRSLCWMLHFNIGMLSAIMPSVIMLSVAFYTVMRSIILILSCWVTSCQVSLCWISHFNIVMLSVIFDIVMLSVAFWDCYT